LEINSIDDLLELAEGLIDDPNLLEGITISPDFNPGNVKITLKGEGYDATISSSVMRALILFQDELYRIYALRKEPGAHLTNEEKSSLEFVVAVNKGSTEIEILVGKALEVMQKMTGSQQIIAISVLAGGLLLYGIGKRWFKYSEKKMKSDVEQKGLDVKIKELEARSKEQEGTNKMVTDVMVGVLETQKDILKHLSRQPFSELVVNGASISKEELHEFTAGHREKKEDENIPVIGMFKIQRIDVSGMATMIDAIHIPSGKEIKNINVLAEKVDDKDYQWLKDAVKNGRGEPIHMTVVRHMHGEEQLFAELLDFDELSEEDALKAVNK